MMAGRSERQLAEETDVPAEVLIFQPESDSEDSSDERFETSVQLEGASSSVSLENRKPDPPSGISTDFPSVAGTSKTDTCVRSKKGYDIWGSFSKDAASNSSSSGSKSLASSIELSLNITEYGPIDEGDSDYVCVDIVDSIRESDLIKLLRKFQGDHYSTKASKVDPILAKCAMLFERDYKCKEVHNYTGCLCNHYPVRIIVPVAAANTKRKKGVEFDTKVYTGLVQASISCRLRKRFTVPVIMLANKFICRAGTITVRKTAVFETTKKSTPPRAQKVDQSPIKKAAWTVARAIYEASSRGREAATQLFIPSSIRKLRDVDAQILRMLNIEYICDLMIEDRKKYKHIRLSSSEKINPDIYRDCNIEQMPYPGCQFFRRYHEANRNPEGLIFNWKRSDVNTQIKLAEDPNVSFPDIEWEDYKEWDVIDLTKNYFKVLLSYLARGTGGLLVHCVSGWDRTPLFISLLRLSLWADGVVHESLNCREMAYLTLAYDWYLFGHDLPSRLKKKEEIMHFCFKFLPYIVSDEFSITRIFQDLPPALKDLKKCSLPEFKTGRRYVLYEMSSHVLKIYDSLLAGVLA